MRCSFLSHVNPPGFLLITKLVLLGALAGFIIVFILASIGVQQSECVSGDSIGRGTPPHGLYGRKEGRKEGSE